MGFAKERETPVSSMALSTTKHLRTFFQIYQLLIVLAANNCYSTCQYAGTNFADALGYVGRGDYLSDTVVFGGVATKNMYFGYTSDYSFPDKLSGDIYTILGKILRLKNDMTQANN